MIKYFSNGTTEITKQQFVEFVEQYGNVRVSRFGDTYFKWQAAMGRYRWLPIRETIAAYYYVPDERAVEPFVEKIYV